MNQTVQTRQTEKNTRGLWIGAGALLAAFAALTAAVMCIDVQPIGPMAGKVGLAWINAAVRDAVGVHMRWYEITDWLGTAAIAVALGFALLGLYQLIRRKKISRVDADIRWLGAFYGVVVGAYVLFECFVVNARPILLSAQPEASFPSSHTMIVTCIMGTAVVQWMKRIRQRGLRRAAVLLSVLIIAVTVAGRLYAGVHWLTDILAGLLLSGGLILSYIALCRRTKS